ncbi:ANTAR domain-containing protein [Streptomyces sp. NPDC048664]|uniref:ANTAR domain-containing protein n=1 Tax=Streptomyces sp. NPDC048664 TaxID=3154505 RepID=UPI00342FB349
MGRGDLTDEQWALLEPLLPKGARRGGRPSGLRAIWSAIGIVVTSAGLRAEDGRNVLRDLSQHTDIKMRHVAELLVEGAQTGHLATAIRHKPERSMATRATLRTEPG